MPGNSRVFPVLSVIVGLGMIGFWTTAIFAGRIPELAVEPIDVYLHLTAEFSTALCLLAGGFGLLTRRSWAKPVHLFSLGMVLYAVIQASGYYAQRSQWAFVVMFGLIALFALTGLVRALTGK